MCQGFLVSHGRPALSAIHGRGSPTCALPPTGPTNLPWTPGLPRPFHAQKYPTAMVAYVPKITGSEVGIAKFVQHLSTLKRLPREIVFIPFCTNT